MLLVGLLVLATCRADAPQMSACSSKWVKMNDSNYRRAMEHYSRCAVLGEALAPRARAKYHSNIIMNMKKTCNYFFDRSNLPTSTLIEVVREVAKILESLDENTISQVKARRPSVAVSRNWPPKGNSSLLNKPAADSLDDFQWPLPENPPQKCRATTSEGSGAMEKTPCWTSTTPCNNTPSGYFTYGRKTRLILWALFWLILVAIVVQLLFIIWLICICLCLGCGAYGGAKSCSCEEGDEACATVISEAEVYRVAETHAELESLSSDNVGSDSEFEVLLKKTVLPKSSNRPFFPKQSE